MTSIETTIRKQNVAKTRIADAFSAGTSFHSTSARISENVNAIIKGAKLPNWAVQYLRGYVDAKFDAIYRLLDFRYQMPDGKWIVAKDIDYTKWMPGEGTPCGHFWTGTDRPFFTSNI